MNGFGHVSVRELVCLRSMPCHAFVAAEQGTQHADTCVRLPVDARCLFHTILLRVPFELSPPLYLEGRRSRHQHRGALDIFHLASSPDILWVGWRLNIDTRYGSDLIVVKGVKTLCVHDFDHASFGCTGRKGFRSQHIPRSRPASSTGP
jgi:hypothetical protein